MATVGTGMADTIIGTAELVCFMDAAQAHHPHASAGSRTFKTRLAPTSVKYLHLVRGHKL